MENFIDAINCIVQDSNFEEIDMSKEIIVKFRGEPGHLYGYDVGLGFVWAASNSDSEDFEVGLDEIEIVNKHALRKKMLNHLYKRKDPHVLVNE